MIKEEFDKKGAILIGDFNCLAFDNFGPFKIIGGLNKGKPDEEYFRKTKGFANKIKEAV